VANPKSATHRPDPLCIPSPRGL